jgi:hypothetical protein
MMTNRENALAQLAEQVSAAGIAPFAADHNGRIREAAMQRCAALNQPDLLPIAASRLNDWVDQVRDAARAAVLALAPACSPEALLGILPGVVALNRARRSDHSAWIDAFEALLVTRLSAQDFAAGIASPDIATSRAAFQLARRSGNISHDELVALALDQRNDILLAQGALALIGELPPPSRSPWYARMATSHFLLLRVAALQARLEDGAAAADALAVATLSDRAASMRDVAMRYLRGRAYDIRGFYRDLLLNSDTPARPACAALAALAGMQSSDDLPLVQSFVVAATPAVRAAALAAWLRLAPGSKDEIALLALRDPAPGLRRFAMTVARKHRAFIPFEEARAILMPLRDYGRLLRLVEMDRGQWLDTLVQLAADPQLDPEAMMTLRTSAQAWREATRYYPISSPRHTALLAMPSTQHALHVLGITAA